MIEQAWDSAKVGSPGGRVTFLKLGGSLITEKSRVEEVRVAVLKRLAGEIAEALSARPEIELVVGHGSGSFGHVAAQRIDYSRIITERPLRPLEIDAIADAAARLNDVVVAELRSAGIAAVPVSPRDIVECVGGRISTIATGPITEVLRRGQVPVVYGDICPDEAWGGAIVSTEQVLAELVGPLEIGSVVLAGDTDGVLDPGGTTIPELNSNNLEEHASAIGPSESQDVTGGMWAKVSGMMALCKAHPLVRITIVSGLKEGEVLRALLEPDSNLGTRVGA